MCLLGCSLWTPPETFFNQPAGNEDKQRSWKGPQLIRSFPTAFAKGGGSITASRLFSLSNANGILQTEETISRKNNGAREHMQQGKKISITQPACLA